MRKIMMMGATLVSIAAIVGVFGIQTGLIHKPDWRRYLNTFLNPYSTHLVLESGGKQVPLPPHSTLAFRYSIEGAVYYTRLSQEDVIRSYQSTGIIKEYKTAGDQAVLTVSNEGVSFLIQASPGFGSGTVVNVKAQ